MTRAPDPWYVPDAVFEGMLDQVHASAPAASWEAGLARASAGAVQLQGCGPEGWALQVDAVRVVWAWTAWRCECAAPAPCMHIVAAAITLDATGEQLRDTPRPRVTPRTAAYHQRSAPPATP